MTSELVHSTAVTICIRCAKYLGLRTHRADTMPPDARCSYHDAHYDPHADLAALGTDGMAMPCCAQARRHLRYQGAMGKRAPRPILTDAEAARARHLSALRTGAIGTFNSRPVRPPREGLR